MRELPNMTASEVLAAEKAWAKESASRASNPAEPLVYALYNFLEEKGLITSDADQSRNGATHLYTVKQGERAKLTSRGLVVVHPERPPKLVRFDGSEELITIDADQSLSRFE